MRPTAEQKANYIALIERDTAAGLFAAEIAERHGISEASVYRWRMQYKEVQSVLNFEAIQKNFSIDNALLILCDDNFVDKSVEIDAFFQFFTWIRWPSQPQYHLAAMINCTSSYYKQKLQTSNIGSMSQSAANMLFKYLTLDVAARFSSPHAGVNPDFEVLTNGTRRYDDRQFCAQIVNYLLIEGIDNKKTHKPTITSLQTLVENGAFGYDWSYSIRTFGKFWRARAASFPFLYIEHYHPRSTCDFSFNPLDNDFAIYVDEILENKQGLREYFGQVKWVIEELRRRLDLRAVRKIDFPIIPENIRALPIKNPPLASSLREKVGSLF